MIYFRGNAGTVGQTRRTDAYRMIASGTTRRAQVLVFDYQGFGHSFGFPAEAGLTDDDPSISKWATTIGKVPTERIVLVAQSLGTVVASGAVEKESTEAVFAGPNAFTDAPTIFSSYKAGGFLPVLYPSGSRHFPKAGSLSELETIGRVSRGSEAL